jgi:FHS family L-fucose permease-like MFS transporter
MLETTANPFIAQFGSPETAERRFNFLQVFNPLGTITGVLIGTRFIISGIELSPAQSEQMQSEGTDVAYLHSEIMRVVPTYVTLGCVVLLLAFAIHRSRFPAIASESESLAEEGRLGPQIASLLRTPSLRAAIIAQFCYCGAQVATWSAFIPYMKQYTQASERVAALFLTSHLVALLLGRIISTSLMSRFSASHMMALYAFINVGLVSVGVAIPGPVGAGALLASSFCMSIMFPTIFATGVRGLGSQTKLGGSLIVMAVVGAAVVPALLGLIAKQTGSYAAAYLVVAACYVPVALYGLRAHQRGQLEVAPNVI